MSCWICCLVQGKMDLNVFERIYNNININSNVMIQKPRKTWNNFSYRLTIDFHIKQRMIIDSELTYSKISTKIMKSVWSSKLHSAARFYVVFFAPCRMVCPVVIMMRWDLLRRLQTNRAECSLKSDHRLFNSRFHYN